MKQLFIPVKGRLYKGFTLAQVTMRPGSLTILAMPSRFGNTLHYPDGRIVNG